MPRQIAKWHTLDNGTRCGRYIGSGDVRGYRPIPEGYSCTAELLDVSPVTGEQETTSKWWVFLTPDKEEQP